MRHNLCTYARLFTRKNSQWHISNLKNLEEKWSNLIKWLRLKSNFDVLAENVCLLVERQKMSNERATSTWQIEIALFELSNLFYFQNKQLFLNLRMTGFHFYEKVERHMKWFRQRQVSLEGNAEQIICISTVTQTVVSIIGKYFIRIYRIRALF